MSKESAELRQEIRLLCQEIKRAIRSGQGMETIRPRPYDATPILKAIFNTSPNWPWPGLPTLSNSVQELQEPELLLYEVIYAVCKSGPSPSEVWVGLMELVESGAIKLDLRREAEVGQYDLNFGEGQFFLATTPKNLRWREKHLYQSPQLMILRPLRSISSRRGIGQSGNSSTTVESS